MRVPLSLLVKFFFYVTAVLMVIVGLIIIYVCQFRLQNPMIWEVSKNGKLFYLGASSHRLPQDNVPKAYFDVLNNVKKFYIEASANCNEVYEELLHENKSNKILPDRFSQEQTLYFKDFLKKYGGDENVDKYTTPAILSMMYTNFDSYYGWKSDFGVEITLINYLKKENRFNEVFSGGLEGNEFCDTFKLYMYEMAAHPELYFKPGGIEATEANVNAKLKAWRTGNLEKFSKLMQPTEIDYKYFNIRTRQWVTKINKIMGDEHYEPMFIVVGAIHVSGEDGLLRLLEGQGYVAKRLDVSHEDQRNVLSYFSGAGRTLLMVCASALVGSFVSLLFSLCCLIFIKIKKRA